MASSSAENESPVSLADTLSAAPTLVPSQTDLPSFGRIRRRPLSMRNNALPRNKNYSELVFFSDQGFYANTWTQSWRSPAVQTKAPRSCCLEPLCWEGAALCSALEGSLEFPNRMRFFDRKPSPLHLLGQVEPSRRIISPSECVAQIHLVRILSVW